MFAYETIQPASNLLASELFLSLHLIDWGFVVFESKCSEMVSVAGIPDCQCKTSGFICYKRFERPWTESWYNSMAPTPANLSTVIMAEQLFWVKPLIFLCLSLARAWKKGILCWHPICSPDFCPINLGNHQSRTFASRHVVSDPAGFWWNKRD